MNMTGYAKYISYIVLFVVFILVRINYNFATNSIYETDFQGLALLNSSFPFEIIKETLKNSIFTPLYYLIFHFPFVLFKNIIFMRIINALIAFCSVLIAVLIGKKLKNIFLGFFLGFFLAINHFFLFYTNQIAPYSLNFLTISLLVYFLIAFLKKPNNKNFKKLTILNCIFILFDNLGFIFIGCELITFYLICEKKKRLKKNLVKFFIHSLIAFLIMLPILIIKYYINLKQLIPDNYYAIGFNFNAFYLMINEFISPYLSFSVPDFQTKSTLGMLYSYFINPDLKNLNILKIAITLFYSSILPLIILVFCSFRAIIKNHSLKILFYISLFYLSIMSVLMVYQIFEANPLYIYPLFISFLILLGYGIFEIKDIFIKSVIILCLFLIQVINPNINSFDVTIKKNYSTINVFEEFKKDTNINKNDLIIMPYLNKYAKLYYKDLNFLNFDYTSLKTNSKNGIIKGFITTNTKSINKYNINYLLSDYLSENLPNTFLTKFFVQNCLNNVDSKGRVVLFVDKLNSKPISIQEIIKQSKSTNYSTSLKKINFNKTTLLQNPTQGLYNTLKSRTLYNFIFLLEESFYLNKIIQYKKIDNEYYKIDSKTNLFDALYSNESDFVFFIFTKRNYF